MRPFSSAAATRSRSEINSDICLLSNISDIEAAIDLGVLFERPIVSFAYQLRRTTKLPAVLEVPWAES
jgi:hypothetical protein